MLGTWLSKNLPSGSRVAVDPKVYAHSTFINLQKQLETMGQKLTPVNQNLIDLIWTDRPCRPANPVKPLPLKYTGKSVGDKFAAVLKEMKEKNVKFLVLSKLDEIAWFLNLRGADITYNPVFFSYVIVTDTSYILFINPNQYNDSVEKHLVAESGGDVAFQVENYDKIESFLGQMVKNLGNGFVWLSDGAPYSLTSLVPSKNLLTEITPIQLMKAVKNKAESDGMRNAHIKDAAALCCYFAWLEEQITNGEPVTEISGAQRLEQFRSQQQDFVGPSFETISSSGAHGAIIHYAPKPETDVAINASSVYLCDSGGQYLDGTTDVTRTMHLGTPTDFEKEAYTRVLKGQLKLGAAVFPTKIKGNHLDSLAREFLWEVGLDYGHGTGHGIGAYLNVHEGPMGISWRHIQDDPGLECGMFLSNEPGFYQDGQFGVRIEDIVEIVAAKTTHNFNDRGYLTFDTITLVPKQTKMIKTEMLTDKEIKQLNDYHQKCRDVVGPLLDQQGQVNAKKWLWKETEPISKSKL